MTTWFTADYHFNHTNIIKYCERPFKDIEEMNYEIVKRHNEVVKPDDTVYNLGDFTLGGMEFFLPFYTQLNGTVIIVPGGHDHRWINAETFSYCADPLVSLEFDIGEERPLVVVLCHYALRVWDRSHYNSIHLYGHSHGNLPSWPNSMDVGVDCHNFYPVSLDEIRTTLQ